MGNNATNSNDHQAGSPAKRQIHFNGFVKDCVGHQSSGMWRYPGDRSAEYTDINHWIELAKLFERGRFDAMFIADLVGYFDVYGGNVDSALRTASQLPINDPTTLISAMSVATENLGFGVTAGVFYEHPYTFARRMSSLDHITNGRVGWNVVTGYLPSALRNMGQDDIPHDKRYDYADEYLEVLYKLWEGSWEDDAVVKDKAHDVYADPTKVHEIDHHGEFFDVPGIHLCEPSPQRTPVIFQAGTSPRGIKFAAENAEAIFVTGPTPELVAPQVKKVRDSLEAAGRGRYDARVLMMLTVITGNTEQEAWDKYHDYERYASTEGALTLYSGWIGTDLSKYDLDQPLDDIDSNAIQSTAANMQKVKGDDGKRWTVRDIAVRRAIGGNSPVIIGSGEQVADELQRIVELTDVDGFNLAYVTNPGTFEDIIDYVVPILQERGVYQTEYAPGTLRNKLFGKGDHLNPNHRGYRYKVSRP
ncbi:LLM class flavin-dependent oxidoreductase [Bifidobacterium tissieri]|nr:LLM class flavin-dependent oxidoreductase [Bifidobacterium tissieri]